MNYKRSIGVLTFLLMASSLSLGARIVTSAKDKTVTIETMATDLETTNQPLADISLRTREIEAPLIELDRQHPSFNQPFSQTNMLPGDLVSQIYCIRVYHDFDLKLYFESTIKEETKALGNVLKINLKQVNDSKSLIFDSFKSIDKLSYPVLLKANEKGYSDVYYQVDVFLDTSTTNAYQAAMLKADFKWYVSSEEYDHLVNHRPITGDQTNQMLFMIWLGSFIMILMLYVLRRKAAN